MYSAAGTLERSRPPPQPSQLRPLPAACGWGATLPCGGPWAASEVSILPRGAPAVSGAGVGGGGGVPRPRQPAVSSEARRSADAVVECRRLRSPRNVVFYSRGTDRAAAPPAARELGIRGLAGPAGRGGSGTGRGEGAVGVRGLLARPPAKVCTRPRPCSPARGPPAGPPGRGPWALGLSFLLCEAGRSRVRGPCSGEGGSGNCRCHTRVVPGGCPGAQRRCHKRVPTRVPGAREGGDRGGLGAVLPGGLPLGSACLSRARAEGEGPSHSCAVTARPTWPGVPIHGW